MNSARKIFLALCLIGLLVSTGSTASAAFEKKSNVPTILIGEVRGYGENELIPEFFDNFRDKLVGALNGSKKFGVNPSRLNINGSASSAEDQLCSLLHKDAIAHGSLYRRELANAEMIRYGDLIMGGGDPAKGKRYFQDDEQTEQRMKRLGKPYELTFGAANRVRELGQKYDADYILFVNLRDADVIRKTGGIFGTHQPEEFRGKKVLVELEYYLIDVKSGKVFEGQNAEKRTSLTTNVLIGRYGQNYTVKDMVEYILYDQSQQLAKGIEKAVKALGGR